MKFSMYTQSLLRRAIRSCFATSQKLSSLAGQLHSFMFLTEWRWRDSNSWPPACKAGALPTELHPHLEYNKFSFLIWQPPAFPYRHQYSIIGRFRLNHRVRDVDGCFPKAHRHQKIASRALALHALEVASQLPLAIKFCLITEQWITFTRFP